MDNDAHYVQLTEEEIKYIMEAFDIFPTINAYGGRAVQIEDSINAKLAAALERDSAAAFNMDENDTLIEDEVGGIEEE